MDWKDEDFDLDDFSWSEKNCDIKKSKSDSSIAPVGDCNFRNQGTQVSFLNEDEDLLVRGISYSLENLNVRNDSGDEDDMPMVAKKRCPPNCSCKTTFQYGIKTYEMPKKDLVVQRPGILIFQGDQHSPDEIAAYWKKDCRTWLWKSVRLRRKRISELLLESN